ncbi:Cytochrome P450, E-class, group I [Parasponia andersonii]|uniref:Cytochrome P450, E-class, group I n=1 Tax=Parasponia andersonii TaxID=3476 RepID=A0A2P5DWC8_PARAD|nr:Cytochrome P450, E-class, group I [Parasponia andersonii]
MESWVLIIITVTVSAFIPLLLKSILTSLFFPKIKKLPPGPPTLPIISSLIWLRKSFSELEPILRNLHTKYGPVVSLRIGSRPAVFVADRFLAHQALVQNGAVFADRPPALPAGKLLNSNQHNISSAGYGPTWRILRRNLTSEILHPSRVKSYTRARKWVLHILLNRLHDQGGQGVGVRVIDHFQYAMFCLLVLMCFGDRLEEAKIKEIETVQRRLLLSFRRFNILNFWPSFTKILLRKRWQELLQLREDQDAVLVPLINSRKKVKEEMMTKGGASAEDESVVCYVDTLLGLELPEEKRKMHTGEMVSLCSEFLNAGTDTTSTALQWIMANLVKHPEIQHKLYEEIKEAVGNGRVGEIEEEDLQRMPYLKAVILEGLRRHPPGHFVLPHAVTEDVVLDGHLVPKKGSVNFMVAEIGWDPKVWEDPMAFKPERFLLVNNNSDNNDKKVEFDITGNREIKMMPFGAGRRICPGFALAMLHLEYFVANLVWKFEWNPDGNDDIDLSEIQEFTVVMKNPLQARLSLRRT